MPEVPCLLLKELAFLWIELYVGFSELLKFSLCVEQLLLECAANHGHIVQVHEA
jgi:hypothetical protein